MLDPRAAAVAFTPLALGNRLHPTIDRLVILPAGEAEAALDAPAGPLDHEVFARPPQQASFAEVMPIMPPGETDPIRGMLLLAVRLVVHDGLDATAVFGSFAAHLDGWAEAINDRRPRDHATANGSRSDDGERTGAPRTRGLERTIPRSKWPPRGAGGAGRTTPGVQKVLGKGVLRPRVYENARRTCFFKFRKHISVSFREVGR